MLDKDLDKFQPIWTDLDQLEQVSTNYNKFGHI